jgi:ABC-type sugar transport system ATPase subunit
VRVSLLALASLSGCSDQTIVALRPIITVGSDAVVFDEPVLGVPMEARVQIGNIGRAPLLVEGVTVDDPFAVGW